MVAVHFLEIAGIAAIGASAAQISEALESSTSRLPPEMVEEYRVSLFAQELHTAQPVSPKRLDAIWTRLFTLRRSLQSRV